MSERITIKHLRAVCEVLNDITNSPTEPWTRKDGRNIANIGNFHVSQAYGGFCIHRMCNSGGAVTTPISYGHGPARELFNLAHSYIRGIQEGKRL